MKKIILYLLMLFIVPTSMNAGYAYDNNYYDINIPNTFKKSDNENYWQKEDKNSSLNILIQIEENTNNLDIVSLNEDDLYKNEYIGELKEYFASFNSSIEISNYSITLDKISSYDAIKIDLESKNKISDEKLSLVYQNQYIMSSKNYVYYITISSSDKSNLNSEEVNEILKSFKIKDKLIEKKSELFKYYICLGIILLFAIAVVILSIKTTKESNKNKNKATKNKK